MTESLEAQRNSLLSKLGAVSKNTVSTEEEEELEKASLEDSESDEEEEGLDLEDPEELFEAVVYPKNDRKEEESELSRLRNEVAELRATLKTRVDEAKKEVVSSPGEDEEEEGIDSSEINWSSPEMLRVFQELGLDEEDAKRLAPGLGRMISATAKLEAKRHVAPIQKKLTSREVTEDREQKQKLIHDNIARSVDWAQKKGGVVAAVANDFMKRGQGSRLYKEIILNPGIALTPGGVVRVIQGIASDVSEQATTLRSKHKEETHVETGAEVTGELSKGNRSAKKLTKKKEQKELTPEEQILKGMLDAGPATAKLPAALR